MQLLCEVDKQRRAATAATTEVPSFVLYSRFTGTNGQILRQKALPQLAHQLPRVAMLASANARLSNERAGLLAERRRLQSMVRPYVSSYSYICVRILLYLSIYAGLLACMLARTGGAAAASSPSCASRYASLYYYIHLYICVRILEYMQVQELRGNIRVICRIRPLPPTVTGGGEEGGRDGTVRSTGPAKPYGIGLEVLSLLALLVQKYCTDT